MTPLSTRPTGDQDYRHTGNSYHTSLTRKSQQEMVDKVVGNILKQRR